MGRLALRVPWNIWKLGTEEVKVKFAWLHPMENAGVSELGSSLGPRWKPGVLGLLSLSHLLKNLHAVHRLKNGHNASGISVSEKRSHPSVMTYQLPAS